MIAAMFGHKNIVRMLVEKEKNMKDNTGRTALMLAAENRNADIVHLLVGKEAGMQDSERRTAMMLSTKESATISLLSPFEAGLTDSIGWNQTYHAIYNRANITVAVRFEKTVGWLLGGKTILEMRIGWRSVSKEDEERIQQNPLWVREI